VTPILQLRRLLRRLLITVLILCMLLLLNRLLMLVHRPLKRPLHMPLHRPLHKSQLHLCYISVTLATAAATRATAHASAQATQATPPTTRATTQLHVLQLTFWFGVGLPTPATPTPSPSVPPQALPPAPPQTVAADAPACLPLWKLAHSETSKAAKRARRNEAQYDEVDFPSNPRGSIAVYPDNLPARAALRHFASVEGVLEKVKGDKTMECYTPSGVHVPRDSIPTGTEDVGLSLLDPIVEVALHLTRLSGDVKYVPISTWLMVEKCESRMAALSVLFQSNPRMVITVVHGGGSSLKAAQDAFVAAYNPSSNVLTTYCAGADSPSSANEVRGWVATVKPHAAFADIKHVDTRAASTDAAFAVASV
jgi:hypothetical protein